MRNLFKQMRFILVAITLTAVSIELFAQQEDWGQAELEAVEIEIVKERQITLPEADRNFEKIPPRPSETIKTQIQYDFRPFTFQTPQINPAIRPLKLKQEASSQVYGGHLSVGYGNYASPYLDAFINSRRDRNKLVGAHAWHSSSDKGPVDGKNSGSGNSGISLYGQSFSEHVSVSGDLGFENRSTHFYGYREGLDVSASDIKQSYNTFKLNAAISNAKNSDFSYKLGGGFSYLADKFDAKETEVNINFNSAYALNDDSSIGIKANYAAISRKDEFIDAKPRSLFTVNPSYVFYPVEDLRLSAGIVVALENDSIDNKDVHAYPDIHVSYPLSPSVNAVASLTGGIEKVSLQSLSRENIWIAPNIPIFHTNKLYDLQLALQTKIGNKVVVNGGFSFAGLKNWYFFVNDSIDQSRFNTEYDRGTTVRTNVFASIGFAQTEAAKFMLRADLYGYAAGDNEEVWHRPTYKVTGDASFNIYRKLLIGINLIAQGGMKAKDYTSSTAYNVVELDAALDLNARLEYVLSESFSIFIQTNNITSNNYPVFLNYPVRGFQVLGGLTWSF